MHYRTWPRESEGGAKFIPGTDSTDPLQPLYDHITVEYNLDNMQNYTMIADNIYNFTPLKIEQ
jgi:hypothetical protein